jgi:predicted transcriptional regulator|tara:strand:+ start:507 stop:707 length:201 start_codon:yes stop_codon:yes gene_type:complete
MRDSLLKALEVRYEAQIAEAEAILEIYLENSVGIGEHPQHIEEIDKLFEKIATAKEKLGEVEEWTN